MPNTDPARAAHLHHSLTHVHTALNGEEPLKGGLLAKRTISLTADAAGLLPQFGTRWDETEEVVCTLAPEHGSQVSWTIAISWWLAQHMWTS